MNGQNRRQEDASVSEILKMMADIRGEMKSFGLDFRNHCKALEELKHNVELILSAFPSGGLMQHRLDHEKWASKENDSNDLRQFLIKGLAQWGILGTMAVIISALWLYFQVKLGK
jgi:hypothetical protein